MDVPDHPPRSVSEKVNALFEYKNSTSSAGKRHTSRELAAFVREHTGRCTEAYISKIRHGHPIRISFDVLQAIALYFSVSVAVFEDSYDWDRLRDQLDLFEALKSSGDIQVRAARAILATPTADLPAIRPHLTALLRKINDESGDEGVEASGQE